MSEKLYTCAAGLLNVLYIHKNHDTCTKRKKKLQSVINIDSSYSDFNPDISVFSFVRSFKKALEPLTSLLLLLGFVACAVDDVTGG